MPETPVTLDLTVTAVIFEGVRRVDEWCAAEAAVPDAQDLVPADRQLREPARGPDPPQGAAARERRAHPRGDQPRDPPLRVRHRVPVSRALRARVWSPSTRCSPSRRRASASSRSRACSTRAKSSSWTASWSTRAARLENVIYLDRLNQHAKKGLMAVSEARDPPPQAPDRVVRHHPRFGADAARRPREPDAGAARSAARASCCRASTASGTCARSSRSARWPRRTRSELLAGLVSRQLIAIKPR